MVANAPISSTVLIVGDHAALSKTEICKVPHTDMWFMPTIDDAIASAKTDIVAVMHDDVRFVPGNPRFWHNMIEIAERPEVVSAVPVSNGVGGIQNVGNLDAPLYSPVTTPFEMFFRVYKRSNNGTDVVCCRNAYVHHRGPAATAVVPTKGSLWIPKAIRDGKAESTADKVQRAIHLAQLSQSKLPDELLHRQGLSSHIIRHFLSNLCHLMQPVNMLEVGTWFATTICCAGYRNDGRFFAIDNICMSNEEDLKVKTTRQDVLASIVDVGKVLGDKFQFTETDCYAFDVATLPKIDVFSYDADHSEEATRRGIEHFAPCLADEAVLVIDDWNMGEVQQGTRAGIAATGREVVYEVALPEWWMGYYVAVLR